MTNDAPEKGKANRKKRFMLLFILLLLAGVAGGYSYWTADRVRTDDAFVDGRIYQVSPRVAGYVTEVLVDDNQFVKKGDPLIRLDPINYEVALAEAKADLASLELGVPLELSQTSHKVSTAEAQLKSLEKGMEKLLTDEEAARQDVARAKALYSQALLDLTRIRTLREENVVSLSVQDEAATAAETAHAAVLAAQAKLESVNRQKDSLEAEKLGLAAGVELAATGEDLAQIKERQVEAQRAKVRQAELDLGHTTILAPADGYITRKGVEPGTMVSKGQPLLAVVPLAAEDLWITANFKETDLALMVPGQEVHIKVDSYPGVEFTGRVHSIMAGTGAVFSLFPPENASGNYVKVVQRVPVRIELNDYDPEAGPVLRLGMSVIPTVFTGRE